MKQFQRPCEVIRGLHTRSLQFIYFHYHCEISCANAFNWHRHVITLITLQWNNCIIKTVFYIIQLLYLQHTAQLRYTFCNTVWQNRNQKKFKVIFRWHNESVFNQLHNIVVKFKIKPHVDFYCKLSIKSINNKCFIK